MSVCAHAKSNMICASHKIYTVYTVKRTCILQNISQLFHSLHAVKHTGRHHPDVWKDTGDTTSGLELATKLQSATNILNTTKVSSL